ncbi:MAG: hypothetical protein JXB39_09015 [Deltaproteobacteria bacterium]|nr:hypothetical protein [Deltaproteobacteria bacterium]
MVAPVLLDRLMETSVRKGARAADVLLVESATLSLGWREGRVSSPCEGVTTRLSGRVFLSGGRQAPFAVDLPGPLDAAALLDRADALLDGAIGAAREAPPDPHAAPADRYDLDVRGRALEDRRHRTLTLTDRMEVVTSNVEGCQASDPGVVPESVEYEESRFSRSFASTRGVSASEASTRYRACATARMGPSGRLHRREIATRQFANLASVPFGYELGSRLSVLHRPARPFEAPVPVLMRPSCTAHLVACLAPAFSAASVFDGRSFLAGLLGQRLASPLLHVIDDPGLPGALESRSFDDQGVPPSPVVILREGVVAGLFVDPRTARARHLQPTGHVVGGETRPSNLVVRPGGRTRNAIGMDLRDYLVLDTFHRPEPLDRTTGHLDTPCDCIVYRNHKAEGALLGLSLSLPVRSLLSSVVEVAADQARYGEVDACTLVIGGLELGA